MAFRRNKGKGWFLMHRAFEEDMEGDAYLIAMWVTLISWANFEKGNKRLAGQKIILERGQLCTSLNELSKYLGATQSITRRCLTYLETSTRINTQKSKHGTIITILNYDYYQDLKNFPTHQTTHQTTHDQHTINTQVNTRSTHDQHYDKKVTTLTSEKRTTEPISKPSRKRAVSVSDHDLELGKKWADWTESEYPYLKAKASTYAEAIAKVRKAVGLDDKQLDYLFDFVKADPFWRQNCQSPAGLLKKSQNGMRKIDNILAKVKAKVEPEIKASRWAADRDALAAKLGREPTLEEVMFNEN